MTRQSVREKYSSKFKYTFDQKVGIMVININLAMGNEFTIGDENLRD
ncbi:hypothetical protein [Bacillus weihaiensis]|nr:hypothetical protein [Bacillus weihaiensis]